MRWLRRLIYVLAAVAAFVGLGVVVPRPLFSTTEDGNSARHILLLSNPIHTDIAVPIDSDLLNAFAFIENDGLPVRAPGAQYLVFGWGGRAFYLETPTWSELKLIPLLKGLTADRSAMHVSLAGELVPGDDSMPLFVSERRYQDLLSYIRASFADVGSDTPIHIVGSGYGDYDTFYEGNGTFTALLGCNTWTSAALRTAGIQTGFWTPMPNLLRTSIRMHGAPLTP